MSQRFAFLLGAILLAAGALARAQHGATGSAPVSGDAGLIRVFSADATSRYRIQLTVRSEVAGEQPEAIGAKTYVHPFSRSADRTVGWQSSRHVISVGSDGFAEIEETLDEFRDVPAVPPTAGDPEAARLDAALGKVLENWARGGPIHLHYRETRNGQLHGIETAGVPRLEEVQPPLLTLWLLRALRPAAAIPLRPVAPGDRWQEPRTARLEAWGDVAGFESGEWLAAPEIASLEPAARLLVVQQMLGKIVAGPEKPPEGEAQGRFHAESLATLSLADARVLAATRSATRQVTWILAPVEGLERSPQFGARLSAQVEIEECHGSCSGSARHPSVRDAR